MKLLILTQKVDTNDDNLSFFHNWIAAFAGQCERVSVICLYEGAHELPAHVRVYSLGKEQRVSRLRYIWNFYRYIIALRHEYDAVLVHMNPEYLILGGALWKFWKKRVGLWYTHKSKRLLRPALFFADLVLSGSVDSFPIPTKKLAVTAHGIDTDHFPSKTDFALHHPLAILSDTRISRSKHVERTLAISELLRERGIDHHITILGGPITEDDMRYKEALSREIALKKLPITVKSVTYKELPAYYQAADIFINHANVGALNKVPLQAMATNLYVLTSNLSYKGILPEGNIVVATPNAFVDAIAKYLKDPVPPMSRDSICKEHNLTTLIGRILGEIKQVT